VRRKPDTLRDALNQVYRSNPTLTGSVRRCAGWTRRRDRTCAEPAAAVRTVGVNQDLTRTGGGNGRNINAGIDVSYPLFNGGSSATRSAPRRAGTRRRAALRATEGDIFTEATAAIWT
jgi:outer membrane protein